MPLKEVLFLGVVAVEQLPLLPKIGTGASFAGLGPTKISLQGFPFSVFDASGLVPPQQVRPGWDGGGGQPLNDYKMFSIVYTMIK